MPKHTQLPPPSRSNSYCSDSPPIDDRGEPQFFTAEELDITPPNPYSLEDIEWQNAEKAIRECPSPYETRKIFYEYLVNSSKKCKVLPNAVMYTAMLQVFEKPDEKIRSKPFRDWVKKTFTYECIGGEGLLLQDGIAVPSREQLYEGLVHAHVAAKHGGRDKTMHKVKSLYAMVPKDVVAKFVGACPTCAKKITKQCDEKMSDAQANLSTTFQNTREKLAVQQTISLQAATALAQVHGFGDRQKAGHRVGSSSRMPINPIPYPVLPVQYQPQVHYPFDPYSHIPNPHAVQPHSTDPSYTYGPSDELFDFSTMSQPMSAETSSYIPPPIPQAIPMRRGVRSVSDHNHPSLNNQYLIAQSNRRASDTHLPAHPADFIPPAPLSQSYDTPFPESLYPPQQSLLPAKSDLFNQFYTDQLHIGEYGQYTMGLGNSMSGLNMSAVDMSPTLSMDQSELPSTLQPQEYYFNPEVPQFDFDHSEHLDNTFALTVNDQQLDCKLDCDRALSDYLAAEEASSIGFSADSMTRTSAPDISALAALAVPDDDDGDGLSCSGGD